MPPEPLTPPVTPPAPPPPTPPATPPAPPPATPPIVGPEWPTDWRQRIAGENQDNLKTLERFTEPKALYDAYSALRTKMSSGELKPTLPKDATPEQITAWRVEAGIPESAEKYDLKLKAGLVIGDDDKPIIGQFLKHMHGHNITNAQASEFVNAYYGIVEAQAAVRADELKKVEKETEDALRGAWGADYRTNHNAIAAVLDGQIAADNPLKAKIVSSMKYDADFAKFMAAVARTINPVTSIIPGASTANLPGAIDSEISTIEKTMRENREAYNRDEKMQGRLRELYTARERIAGQPRAA